MRIFINDSELSTQQMQSPQMGGIVQQSPEGQMPNQMNKTKTALANMLSNRLGNNNNGNYNIFELWYYELIY